MEHDSAAREWMLKTALAYLGTPYRWGGDDPSGFDCSGFVLECLKIAGLVQEHVDLTADQILKLFATQKVDTPQAGALLFMIDSSGKATHVVVCLDQYFQIGASGGDASTSDQSKAWNRNAFVRIRPIRYDQTRHCLVFPFAKEEELFHRA